MQQGNYHSLTLNECSFSYSWTMHFHYTLEFATPDDTLPKLPIKCVCRPTGPKSDEVRPSGVWLHINILERIKPQSGTWDQVSGPTMKWPLWPQQSWPQTCLYSQLASSLYNITSLTLSLCFTHRSSHIHKKKEETSIIPQHSFTQI